MLIFYIQIFKDKGATLLMYKRSFLFHGIGSKPEKIISALTPELKEKYDSYLNEALIYCGLPTDLSLLSGHQSIAAEWFVPFICDRVIFEFLKEKGITPDIGAGYSSGIVSASACFGAIKHTDALNIVMTHLSMLKALEENNVKLNMGIVIGFPYDELKDLLSSRFSPDDLVIGSGNSSFHMMISGKAEAVEKAIELCTSEGALKAFPMNTGTAFHHPIMEKYSTEYLDFCRNMEYREPDYPLMSVFDHNVLSTIEGIRQENVYNVYTPMRWDLALKKLEELGVTEFFDLSANGAIKKFSRVSRKAKIYTLEDILSGDCPALA